MLDSTQIAVLRVAVDDYWGLWELLPEITDASVAANENRLVEAQGVVRQMLNDGLLDLYIRDGPVGTPIQLDSPASDLLLNDVSSWELPREGGTQVLIAATAAGAEAYFGSTPES